MARAQRDIYERLPRRTRHRIRIHNKRLKGRLHQHLPNGYHLIRQEEGVIWFYIPRRGDNYTRLLEVVGDYGQENGVRYRTQRNPKGAHRNEDWVWIIPEHESFRRDDDEQFDLKK